MGKPNIGRSLEGRKRIWVRILPLLFKNSSHQGPIGPHTRKNYHSSGIPDNLILFSAAETMGSCEFTFLFQSLVRKFSGFLVALSHPRNPILGGRSLIVANVRILLQEFHSGSMSQDDCVLIKILKVLGDIGSYNGCLLK